MLDLIIVLVALGLLIYFAFKGISLIILAPVAALFTAAVTGDLPILGAYTQIFMGNTRLIHRLVLPAVPARRHLRQADG